MFDIIDDDDVVDVWFN